MGEGAGQDVPRLTWDASAPGMPTRSEPGALRRALTALTFAIPFFVLVVTIVGGAGLRDPACPIGGDDIPCDVQYVRDEALWSYLWWGTVALVPAAVLTVGLGVDLATRRMRRGWAALLHGAAGLVLGVGVAGYQVMHGIGPWWTMVAGFAVPTALAALATGLVVPTASRRRGIAALGWIATGGIYVIQLAVGVLNALP